MYQETPVWFVFHYKPQAKINDIPKFNEKSIEIIDASLLIDAENKIKMVGALWLNEEIA